MPDGAIPWEPSEPENNYDIYEAGDPDVTDLDTLLNLLNQYLNSPDVPVWFRELSKTALSRNITIDDWNTLCYNIRRIVADKVSYKTLKSFSGAIINYINNNFSLKGHNLVSVRVESNELCFEFEDGSHFWLTPEDFNLHPISQLELDAMLDTSLSGKEEYI